MQPQHHKCQVCLRETPQELAHTDVACYSGETSNLVMVSKLACKDCREEISTIRLFVEENGLAFGRNSRLYRDCVEPYLGEDARDRQSTKDPPSHPQ